MPVRFETAEGDVRLEGACSVRRLRPRYELRDVPGLGLLARARGTRRARRGRGRGRARATTERAEVERQVPVAVREPELRDDERGGEQQARDQARRPATSGTTGISQIRNCGDSTLPKATKATRAAALARAAARGGRAAGEQDPGREQRGELEDRGATASASGRSPPGSASRGSSPPSGRARTCGGRRGGGRRRGSRPAAAARLDQKLSQTPCGASTRNGTQTAATTPSSSPPQMSASASRAPPHVDER